jgi:hypothetical protein
VQEARQEAKQEAMCILIQQKLLKDNKHKPDPKGKAQAKPEDKLPPVRSQPLVKNYEDYDSDDESSIMDTSAEI